MNKIMGLAGVALLATTITSYAAEDSSTTHTMPGPKGGTMSDEAMPPKEEGGHDKMLSGSHMMPGQKPAAATDKSMPSMSPDCSEAALAKMPPEHRKACGK